MLYPPTPEMGLTALSLSPYDQVQAAAATLRDKLAGRQPKTAVILGSGLGAFADSLSGAVAVGYDDIPGFPPIGVSGHAGRIVVGNLSNDPGAPEIACMQGRVHAYEGRPDAMAVPIRTLQAIGVETLYITCAAGSLRLEVGPASLMTIVDHLNLMGQSPLVGPNDDRIGPRFPPMADAYDPDLVAMQRAAAADLGIDLADGVYAAWLGPAFETPAEVRMIRALGADAVGMSVVPEVLLARHCGLKVTATAVITNFGVGLSDMEINHAQTLAGAAQANEAFQALLRKVLSSIA